jgi:hypothetical protein
MLNLQIIRSTLYTCFNIFLYAFTVPPDILDYPTSTDMMVREGNNVTLRCAATGTPEPTVTWRREAGGIITLSNLQEGKILKSYSWLLN